MNTRPIAPVAAALVALGLLLVAPGRPSLAGDGRANKLDLPVAGMACEGCASTIAKNVGALDGVSSVRADHETARVVVFFDPKKITESRIRRAIADLGYVIGDDDPPVVYPKGADVKTISKNGEDVRVDKHLAAGTVTVVDFYADWCKPCKALDRRLAAKVAADIDGLAVRKVNIVSWDTPVAKRYLRKVSGLPHIRIYDQRGKLVATLSQDKVDRLDEHLRELGKRGRR